MGYDISDDAESRFSEREAGWEESQRVVCYKDCELACEAVYKNRAGKPRNFLELSDNDVDFCRNVVQATTHFLFVFFCTVCYTIYNNTEHTFASVSKGGHTCIRYSFY